MPRWCAHVSICIVSPMMIIDAPGDNGGTVRAAVTGSCRVYAPLNTLAGRAMARTVFTSRAVFSYSAAEAIQEFAYGRGLLAIPDRFAPLLLNRARAADLPPRLPRLVDSCQVCLVEISSLDHLECAGLCFNDLAIVNRLVRGWGPARLAWFRQLSSSPSPPGIVAAALDAMATGDRARVDVDEELLTCMTRERATPTELDEQVARIMFARDRRWIFQPLFGLPDRTDAADPKRTALRGHVGRAAEKAGAEFYDVSPLIARAGRDTALDGGGVDAFHFAPDFLPTVGDALRDILTRAPAC
jgi:hypothetical protein